jgi:hypothetical protein
LKFDETGKLVGNIGLSVGITDKPVPKPINYFLKNKF